MIPYLVLVCVLAFVVWLAVWSIFSLVKIVGLQKELTRQAGQLTQLRNELLIRRGAEAAPAPPPLPAVVSAPAPLVHRVVAPDVLTEPPFPMAPEAPGPDVITEPPFAMAQEAPGPDVITEPPFPVLARQPVVSPSLPPFVEPTAPSPVARTSAPPSPVAVAASPVPRGLDWEQFLGVKAFAWIGALALFLGVAFFIKLSIDNNWISPELRVSLGFLAGAGLLAGGGLLARGPYRVTSQALCAAGVVILYAVTFACRSLYHFEFFGMVPTFLLMALITAAAFVTAVTLEAQVVALLGLLGGFLTPVLISTGQDNPLGLFGYIALLDVGLLAVALHRRWHYLAALAAVGTTTMEIAWVAEFFTAAKIYTALNVFLGFSVLFLLAQAVAGRRGGATRWLAGAAAGAAFVALGFALFLLDQPRVAQQPWLLFSFVLGADLCLLALAVLDAALARLHLAAGAVAFLLLAVWTGGQVTEALLPWALAACLVFGVLHTAFPLVLQRVRPAAAPAWWAHLFPVVALLIVLLDVMNLRDVSFLVWPFVLAIDLLAIGVALATGLVLAVAAALGMTLVVTAFWILKMPVADAGLPSLLLVVGGFGALFYAAGVYVLRRRVVAAVAGETAPSLVPPDGAEHLPAMAGALPFLLLIMIVLRLPLTDPSPVFGLALLLGVLLLGLARMLGRGVLPLVALGCTALLEYVWLGRRFSPDGATVALAWGVGFYAVFAAFPFAFRRQFSGQLAPWVASALAGPVHFLLVHQIVHRAWPNDYMGVIPLLFAVPALAGLAAALRSLPADAPRRLDVLAWFGGVALLFVTLIFPIQFDRQWITLGWALEGAALLWLFRRVPHEGLRLAGVALLVAAFVRLALNGAVLSYHPRSATAIFNWYLYAYGITTLCLLAGARLLAASRSTAQPGPLGVNAPAALYTLAGVLAFFLLNIEIADYFNAPGRVLTFEFTGSFARDMTYTIAWALYALGLLVLGLARRVLGTRWAAIGLLSATLLKLFLHDLAHLDRLYRIGAFLVVAVIAILASFLYQRFLPKEKDS
jgi:uncharacterized membrane protein